jgi:adenosylhomocysteinase
MHLQLVTPVFQEKESFQTFFKDIIPETERQCMASLDTAAALLKLSALQDKHILINCHLTLSTLMMIDILLKAGSTVSVTYADDLVFHQDILDKLCQQGLYIPFVDLNKSKYKTYFDLVIDYGGYLANILQPTAGFIELAHVEHKRYLESKSPIISVDASFIKYIETTLGTGDGFVRAVKKIAVNNEEDYTKQTFLVFGYGKVGRGIAHCLVQAGVAKNKIMIVEVRDKPLTQAKKNGYIGYNLVNQYEAIRLLLPKVDYAVTATGISGTISRYFTLKDFEKVTYLANMGTYDEWGQQFPASQILHHKKPLNFILEIPTRVCYLDPIFALMIESSAYAFDNKKDPSFKVYKPPKTLQKDILETWMNNTGTVNPLDALEQASGEKFDFA